MVEFNNRTPPMHTTTLLPIQRSLKRLGQNISKARRRRHWMRKDLATQMGVSVSTTARLEKGEPGVGLQTLISALLALNLLDEFNALLETPRDTVGLTVQDEHLPKRVRKSREKGTARE